MHRAPPEPTHTPADDREASHKGGSREIAVVRYLLGLKARDAWHTQLICRDPATRPVREGRSFSGSGGGRGGYAARDTATYQENDDLSEEV